MEFNPPTKKAVFVVYLVEQNDGIVTATADYAGDSDQVLDIGMDVMIALTGMSKHMHENLYVHNKVSILGVH